MSAKQLALFEIESVGEVYKPFPLDLSNEEHIKQCIAWQKKNSFPLFEPETKELKWVPVSNWDYEVEWEVNYEEFGSYYDALEARDESNLEGGWTTVETTLRIKIEGRKIYEIDCYELEELSNKSDVVDHLDIYGDEFHFQGDLYAVKYNPKTKQHELHKTKHYE